MPALKKVYFMIRACVINTAAAEELALSVNKQEVQITWHVPLQGQVRVQFAVERLLVTAG